jgi:hypothetical protein
MILYETHKYLTDGFSSNIYQNTQNFFKNSLCNVELQEIKVITLKKKTGDIMQGYNMISLSG